MVHRPETTAAPGPTDGDRRLAAIVFTDVVGYSGVVHRNEVLGQQMLDRQGAVVRSVLPRFGGREVRLTGDGFLLEFGSALSAVKALAVIQTRLATDDQASGCPVTLRASVHLGDVDHVAGDVYGDGVNIAARLMPLSPEGGIALSSVVHMQVRQQIDLELRSIGTPPLKNIAAPLEVFVADPPALHALGRRLLEVAAPAAAAAAGQATPPARRRAWGQPLAAASVFLLALALAFGVLHRRPGAGPPSTSTSAPPAVAVLPFANTGGDPANEYFSDGLSEELINTLGRVNTLKVIGRTSSFRFKNTSDDATTIGQKLGVDYLVDGSVRKASDRVRIAITLVRTADGTSLWSDSYDRELKDIFAVQSEIATAVTGQLQRSLTLPSRESSSRTPEAARPPGGNVEAYQAYLQGNFYARRNNAADYTKAIGFYEQAIALDPRYALAYAQLAQAGFWYASRFLTGSRDQRDALMARSRAAVASALQLDPDLAQAHSAHAVELKALDLRFDDAEREYRRAVALAPNDADVMGEYGRFLFERGRIGPALAALDRAVALDPLSRDAHFRRGRLLDLVGRLDEAEAALLKAIEIEPQAALTHAVLAVTKLRQGDTAAAVACAVEEKDSFWRTWALALALFAHGDRTGADAALDTLLREYADVAAFQIAEIYALRKDADAAFLWLDRALAARDPGVTQLYGSALLLAYRDDPRYAAIARKVGLDPAHAPAAPARTSGRDPGA